MTAPIRNFVEIQRKDAGAGAKRAGHNSSLLDAHILKPGQAEEIRHASDYDDFYIASREEAEQQAMTADEFIRMAEEYCMKKIKSGSKIRMILLPLLKST